MFTGIIEEVGTVRALEREGGNLHITVSSNISKELKVDQSVAHNGVCLTVVQQTATEHIVTAVEETLQRTNLGALHVGDALNLERCMRMDGRLDGHLVQGHVDVRAECIRSEERSGSWNFHFRYPAKDPTHITVTKGSITVNGVSLTVVESKEDSFSVTIIPYTFEHTHFKTLKEGDLVNLEFDILGKYVARLMQSLGSDR